jgi:hypothetical protein
MRHRVAPLHLLMLIRVMLMMLRLSHPSFQLGQTVYFHRNLHILCGNMIRLHNANLSTFKTITHLFVMLDRHLLMLLLLLWLLTSTQYFQQ